MYEHIPEYKLPANGGCAIYWLSVKIIKIIIDGKTDAEKASIDVYRCISSTVRCVVEPWLHALAIIGTEMSKLYYEVCKQKALGLWHFGRCPATWTRPHIKYNFQMGEHVGDNQESLHPLQPLLSQSKYEKILRNPDADS